MLTFFHFSSQCGDRVSYVWIKTLLYWILFGKKTKEIFLLSCNFRLPLYKGIVTVHLIPPPQITVLYLYSLWLNTVDSKSTVIIIQLLCSFICHITARVQLLCADRCADLSPHANWHQWHICGPNRWCWWHWLWQLHPQHGWLQAQPESGCW